MKKSFVLFAFFIFLFPPCINAQLNYSFSATTATYVPVSGGIVPALISRPFVVDPGAIYSFTYDEGIASNLPLGFIFNYNGVDYTTINICANGFATLGTPFNEDVNLIENFYINNLELGPLENIIGNITEPGTKPVLAVLWDDLNCQADANLRYITTGLAGSRVFTFEWSNAKWQFDATGSTVSFELKLYEGTNVVEFWYKDEGGSANNASASIGITASDLAGGGFISLQNTTASPSVSTIAETNDLSAKPASNQVYRFTPLNAQPVTLINFSGEVGDKINILHWITAAELNNTGFEVQRSSDGNTFSKIGFTDTKSINGNSNANLNYDFMDKNYTDGINYYRLKQIDKDGKFSYSNIVVLKNNNALASSVFTLYPIPTKSILNIKFASHNNDKIILSVTDVSGKIIIIRYMSPAIGETIIPLDVSQLAAGIYFLKIISSGKKETAVERFIKQ